MIEQLQGQLPLFIQLDSEFEGLFVIEMGLMFGFSGHVRLPSRQEIFCSV
jgi:hypothetical protein